MPVDRERLRDPEVMALTMQIRNYTGQIHDLVREIDKTVVLLEERTQREPETP